MAAKDSSGSDKAKAKDKKAKKAKANRAGSRFWKSAAFKKWLNKRMPPSSRVKLNQSNIFILPTREGLYFILVTILMLLAGLNYQNSLIYGLAFMLISVFMVSILHTFRNLSGLSLQAGHTQSVFAGEEAEFTVHLSREGKRTYEALVVGWDAEHMRGVDLVDEVEVIQKLYVPTKRRGRFNPGRLLVETHYPVGLFRAWSWVDLDMMAIVYPAPIASHQLSEEGAPGAEGESIHRSGTDDFYGMKEYQAGDSLRHIAWKSFARTDELLIKEFAQMIDRRLWLDWELFPGMDREARLSRLCYWVVKLSQTTDAYGLRLPGLEIPPANGPEHTKKLLMELALFELDGPGSKGGRQ